MTGDTITPVSMFPVVHATWDDPDHPAFNARQKICNATATLKPFGLQPDGSIAAFASHQFALLQHARAILSDAARHGSRVCERYDVDAQQMLDCSMPNRVVIGPLGLGASATNGMINNVLLLPGLDAAVLRAGDEHHVEVLAYGLDHLTDTMAPLLRQLHKLAIVSEDDFFDGLDLTDLLSSDRRWQLPGLDEISPRALAMIATDDLAGHCGVTIDNSTVRYFRVTRARLKSSERRRLSVNLLVRVRPDDMVIWSTTQPLRGTHTIGLVLSSELRLGAQPGSDASTMLCLDRFFATFTPHKAQPSALTTRTYINALIMLANQGTVACIRNEQARLLARAARQPVAEIRAQRRLPQRP